ncbi:MAG TPA: recombinase, partial [Actinomycetota bacterium]|nr:recombinase [Actinomycetota bacterium]
MPRCADCGQTKEAVEFPRNRSTRSGLHPYCKLCHNRRTRESVRKSGGSRKYHLKRRYRLTLEEFDR